MESCLFNNVYLLVIFLAIPSLLDAWIYNPSTEGTVVTGGYFSTGTIDPEERIVVAKKMLHAKSTSGFKETIYPTGKDLFQTQRDQTQYLTVRKLATEHGSHISTETSWTVPLSPAPRATTEYPSQWEDPPAPAHLLDTFAGLSEEPRSVTEEAMLARDSPHDWLRLGDAADMYTDRHEAPDTHTSTDSQTIESIDSKDSPTTDSQTIDYIDSKTTEQTTDPVESQTIDYIDSKTTEQTTDPVDSQTIDYIDSKTTEQTTDPVDSQTTASINSQTIDSQTTDYIDSKTTGSKTTDYRTIDTLRDTDASTTEMSTGSDKLGADKFRATRKNGESHTTQRQRNAGTHRADNVQFTATLRHREMRTPYGDTDTRATFRNTDPRSSFGDTDSRVTSIDRDTHVIFVNTDRHSSFRETDTRATSRDIDTHTPSRDIDTHTPSRDIDTHTPSRDIDTHTPSRDIDTHTPSRDIDTHTPSRDLDTHTPSRDLDTHTPSRDIDTHTPSRGIDTHTPSRDIDTHTPSSDIDTHTPSRDVDTDATIENADTHSSFTETDTHATYRDMDTGTVGVPVQRGGPYLSTTMSRAGERTLLSIPSNSTSSMYTTEDSNSQQPSFSWETTDGRGGLSSTRARDVDSTSESHPTLTTNSSDIGPSATERMFAGTQTLRGTTQYQDLTSGTDSGPYSTPPLVVLEQDTAMPGGGTVPSEVSVSSVPPLLSSEGDVSSTWGRGQRYDGPLSVGTSTESSTGIQTSSSTTQREEETEAVPSFVEEASTIVGLTTAPPSVPDSMTAVDDSLSRFLSGQSPSLPRTERPALATEVLQTTTPGSVTHKPLVTEEEGSREETLSTSTTPTKPPTTTRPFPSSNSPTLANVTPTTPSTAITTTTTTTAWEQQTPSPSTPQHRPPTQTQGTSTGFHTATDVTTLHLETSTATPGITTDHGEPTTFATTAPYSEGTPTKSNLETLHTTGKHTDQGSTEVEVTTLHMSVGSTSKPVSPCTPDPCINGGVCGTSGGIGFTCHCLPAWTGPTCQEDVDECVGHPCPSGSSCVNTRGSFSCECPLGFDLEDGRTCTKAKTFLGTFTVTKAPTDQVLSNMHELQREILLLLNASLSILHGYRRSTVSKRGDFPEGQGVRIAAVNMFSVSTDVSSVEVFNSVQMTMANCSSSLAHCSVVLHHQLSFHVESLCVAQHTQCDQERSSCSDSSGTAFCQCLPGYYKHNPEDLSCIECGDGFKLENGTCVQCTFGFGGFNCANFYKLIAVVVLPAGGGVLLILLIALIVTCCKKDKNDISKIIFKSGDLQMSPYADFPKSNRVSMEWGRETIEMQENGSTKNLLQMNDIYYSPALRNADLERNGLYPFTGLPGSRHSCIYPAQWNPSFTSDDSRRRDYF